MLKEKKIGSQQYYNYGALVSPTYVLSQTDTTKDAQWNTILCSTYFWVAYPNNQKDSARFILKCTKKHAVFQVLYDIYIFEIK